MNGDISEEVARHFYEKGYRDGMKNAVTALAVWKDGAQLVGVMQTPLKEVTKRIDEKPLKELILGGW